MQFLSPYSLSSSLPHMIPHPPNCPYPTQTSAQIHHLGNLSVLPDNQVKELAMIPSNQWASTLLQDIYDFVKVYLQTHHDVTCPMPILQFHFVITDHVMADIPGLRLEKKEVF